MPRRSHGQKRPTDVIGYAVHTAQIVTGEIQEATLEQSAERNCGLTGAKPHVNNTIPEQLQETARKAVAARWE